MSKPQPPARLPTGADEADLHARIHALVLAARQTVARGVDQVQLHTNFEIGRHIVEHQQQGRSRAAYGKDVLKTLAQSLTAEFGSGFSLTNLKLMRQFYLQNTARIGQTLSGLSLPTTIGQIASDWWKSHYRPTQISMHGSTSCIRPARKSCGKSYRGGWPMSRINKVGWPQAAVDEVYSVSSSRAQSKATDGYWRGAIPWASALKLNPGRNMGKTNALNDGDLVDFVQRQNMFADSAQSWSVDVAGLNPASFDLSVRIAVNGDEVVLRMPAEILDEIAAPDVESAEVMAVIRELI